MPKVADGGRLANYMEEYLYYFFTTFVLEKERREKEKSIIPVARGSSRCDILHVFSPNSFMELSQRIRSRF